MKPNSAGCPAVVTIQDTMGPFDCQCTLVTGHEGSHETAYNRFTLSWYDLAPQPVEAKVTRQPRPAGPEQEPFRAKHYTVKKV